MMSGGLLYSIPVPPYLAGDMMSGCFSPSFRISLMCSFFSNGMSAGMKIVSFAPFSMAYWFAYFTALFSPFLLFPSSRNIMFFGSFSFSGSELMTRVLQLVFSRAFKTSFNMWSIRSLLWLLVRDPFSRVFASESLFTGIMAYVIGVFYLKLGI